MSAGASGQSATSRPKREKTLRDELMAAGLAAADEWLATRAHRRMSEVNRRRLVGHIVDTLWKPTVDAALEIAHMVSEDVEAERDRLLGEVEQLRRPLMVVQVDADLSEEDVERFRAKWQEAHAADHRPKLLPAPAPLRLVEWTLGDDYEPYDYRHVYNEADARAFAADPDSSSVLWRREATEWRKVEAEQPAPTAGDA